MGRGLGEGAPVKSMYSARALVSFLNRRDAEMQRTQRKRREKLLKISKLLCVFFALSASLR